MADVFLLSEAQMRRIEGYLYQLHAYNCKISNLKFIFEY